MHKNLYHKSGVIVLLPQASQYDDNLRQLLQLRDDEDLERVILIKESVPRGMIPIKIVKRCYDHTVKECSTRLPIVEEMQPFNIMWYTDWFYKIVRKEYEDQIKEKE